MPSSEVITAVTYIFFVALVVALFVERLMEIVVAVYKYLEFRLKWASFWNRLAELLALRLQALEQYFQSTAPAMGSLVQQFFRRFIQEAAYPGAPWKVSAPLVRRGGIRAAVRFLAFGVSLGMVVYLKLDLVALVVDVVNLLYPLTRYLDFLTRATWVHYVLTAAVISMGAEPLHTLIVRFERLNERAEQKRQVSRS